MPKLNPFKITNQKYLLCVYNFTLPSQLAASSEMMNTGADVYHPNVFFMGTVAWARIDVVMPMK